ncbi:hypothetical protein TRV_01046 [Trichophyton verrucosum HKI 0517]|uniref:Uncharacterized protein n=1 Tax=Trichophyton verrucosum (strain HKI 0517) TaxID=663202 RepID=D4D1U4_TRIVH|nr:uncharacterized protein TRV_01046 [Trichophyton verrucosum HKI 0517]EFE44153.1 hypothetical protein TRV_01046 [Trichophyton verrucosum HKI 0517]
MPTLKQLTCHIEWANCSIPFKEYGVTYRDGSVECLVPVQPASTPFSIRLTSSGYIAPGLAMFVYMDGVYQCNRNRDDLILKKGCKVQLMPGMPEVNKSHFDNLGEICVVVLRCESRDDQSSFEGSLTPESAMAFGPDLDDFQSVSSEECLLNPINTTKENDTSCGFMGGLFDGANDTRHCGNNISCCKSCDHDEPKTHRESRGHRHDNQSSINNRDSRRRHPNPARSQPQCRVHWKDQPELEQESDWDNGWESYDTESTASSDRVCQGYRYYRSSGPTNPSPRQEAEESDSPRSCIREHRSKPRQYLPYRAKQDQSSGWKIRKGSGKLSSEEPKGPQNLLSEEIHSGTRGCAPSIVLNVNSAQPTQEMNPVINHTCHNNDNTLSTNDDTGTGNDDGDLNTSNENQDNNGSSWDNNNDQGNSNWNNDNNETSAGWNNQDSQNNTMNDSWDQGQGDQQNNNNNTDDWDKGNTNFDSNAQGQQQSTSWDNGNQYNGQEWMARGATTGNGDAPAAGWLNNNSNDNHGHNNDGQWAPMASPNNGYNNPQPGPASPLPVPVQAQGPIWESPPPIQRVHTLITPFCQGPEASEPPLYTAPEQVAQERALSHQVQVGRSSRYSHKIKVPQYIDTMEEPYAKFIFKYRVKGVVESEIGKPIERDVEAERKLLESLPREEILKQLLHAQGLLAAQTLGQTMVTPAQGQPQVSSPQQIQHQHSNSNNQQYVPAQHQSPPGSKHGRVHHSNHGSQSGPSHWNSAPAQEQVFTVPSKLTGYNNRAINPPQSPPQNNNLAAALTTGLQNVQQQQQQQSWSKGSNDAPSWNAQATQDDSGGKW